MAESGLSNPSDLSHMSVELYLCSTPLHILNAVAIASGHRRQSEHHIWLIDQPVITDNPYYQLLMSWKDSPFSSCRITQGRVKGLRQKLGNRRRVFAEIATLVRQIRPDRIYTGNDRRIEFQYAMHHCEDNGCNTTGIYMDEGTFTYVGRAASASFSDRVVDNWLKKVTYGFWWQNPPTIGGSGWISEVYAAFPEHVHTLLKDKTLVPLQDCFRDNPTVTSFCSRLVSQFGADAGSLTSLTAVLTLPHESIIDRLPGYREAMLQVLSELTSQGVRVGVKYHPRNSNPDILNAGKQDGCYVIPYRIPFEALLPLLPEKSIIIGDVSSTLINSRWLKPDANILSLHNNAVPEAELFSRFFAQIGVETLEISDLLTSVQKLKTLV